MNIKLTYSNVIRTVPLSAILFESTDDTDEVTFLPLDIFNVGLEAAQLDRRRVARVRGGRKLGLESSLRGAW